MRKTGYISLLKNKTFLKVWLAQLLSLTTANMLNFILMDRIYSTTRSTVAVGLFWGFYILPSATLGPFVGVFLDYLSKKKIFIFSNLIQAFVVLFYLGVETRIWTIYTIVLLYSFCDEFFNPAVGAFLPAIVKKPELPAANGLYLLTTHSALILGFLGGGIILRYFHFARLPFVLSSLLLLLAAGLSSFIAADKPALKRKPQAGLKDFLQDLVEGYQFIRGEAKILFPTILLAGLQVVIGIGVILLPSISQDHLEIMFADSAFAIVVPGILGAMIGSFLVEKLLKRYLKRVLIISGLYLSGFAVLILAMAPILANNSGYFGAVFALTAGIAVAAMLIPLQTLVQEHTPFDIRGRVFGTLSTLVTLAAAVPVLVTTTLVDFLGIFWVLFLMGLMLVFLASYAARGKYGIIPANNRH